MMEKRVVGGQFNNQIVITYAWGGNETYTFDEGMTWREWLDSEYNTGGLYAYETPDEAFVRHPSFEILYIVYSDGQEEVLLDDYIIENANYMIG